MNADEIAPFREQAAASTWAKQLQENKYYGNLIKDPDNPPEWLINFRAQQLAWAARDAETGGKLPPKPRGPIRVGNGSRHWIKRDNGFEGGIRKHRSQILDLAGGATNRRGVMAGPKTWEAHQRHMIHMMHRVLSIRTSASPFTLILDSLNQRSQPLLTEFVRRALSRNVNVILVAFEASNNQHPAMNYIAGSQAPSPEHLVQEIKQAMENFKESLVIVDNLYELIHIKGVDMNVLFDLVAMRHCSTLIGVYHQDIMPQVTPGQEYSPEPLKLFDYLATTVIRCISFAQALAIKAAKERSLPEPTHGLLMGAEGIVQCLKANDIRGIVLEAEFRRKSGRPESETYFLPPSRSGATGEYNAPQAGMHVGTLREEFVKLIVELPQYTDSGIGAWLDNKGNATDDEIETRATFKLSLTEKEKVAREGVVLPYHDAQNQQGESGEGGRILYDMGAEDDFDEEEDDI
ncbi:hypothetical protein K491DRAFT_697921 [Lophiostoma macrostomum CBS 122681]|uniref:Elongator complex protein 5 n=1 Tax=Lophiostoma macrostomum CBS 122681 TaxID=1314788 RepID=A0A6A6SQ39_9PLEO|nr:hypothetical protein K491DRAFT_697921 [Lophiostoma macrostomum CBS 122681]